MSRTLSQNTSDNSGNKGPNKALDIVFAAKTDTGRVRKHNEDAIYSNSDKNLWVLADGMGGYACGEVASALTVETIVKAADNGTEITSAIQAAHAVVISRAQASESSRGMASTVMVLQLAAPQYHIAWVGDSRAYLLRDNRLRQISRDHSYYEWLIDQGLSPQEAANDPKHERLTRGIGLQTPEVDTRSGELQPGDRILLCSDGLYNEANDGTLEALLQSDDDCQQVCDALFESAMRNGGKDNISIILVDVAPKQRKRLKRKLVAKQRWQSIGQHWRLWLPPAIAVGCAGLIFTIFLMIR